MTGLDFLTLLNEAPVTSASEVASLSGAVAKVAQATTPPPVVTLAALKVSSGKELGPVIAELSVSPEAKARMQETVEKFTTQGVMVYITPESLRRSPLLLDTRTDDPRYPKVVEAGISTNTPFKPVGELLKCPNLTSTALRDINEAIRLAAKVAGCPTLKWRDSWITLPLKKKEEAISQLIEVTGITTETFDELFAQRDKLIREREYFLPLLATLFAASGRSHEKLDTLVKQLRGPYKPGYNEGNELLQGQTIAFHVLKGAKDGSELIPQLKTIWDSCALTAVAPDEVTQILKDPTISQSLRAREATDFKYKIYDLGYAVDLTDRLLINAITYFVSPCGRSIDTFEDRISELFDSFENQQAVAKELGRLVARS